MWNDGFSAALAWICIGGPDPLSPSLVDTFDSKVTEAIRATLREDFGRDPSKVFVHSRKRELVMLRVFSWEAYQMFTGASMLQTMKAFGREWNHATFIHAKKNIIGSLDYFPGEKQNFHRFLCGVQSRLDAATKDDRARFVDLGLPSGTLWSDRNIIGYHDETILRSKTVSDMVPSRSDYEELIYRCDHRWSDDMNGVFFVGKNGNSVFFPASGAVAINGLHDNGHVGFYLINKGEDETDDIFRFIHSIHTSFAFTEMPLKKRCVSVRTISKPH